MARKAKLVITFIGMVIGVLLLSVAMLWGLWAMLIAWWLDKDGYRLILLGSTIFWVSFGVAIWPQRR